MKLTREFCEKSTLGFPVFLVREEGKMSSMPNPHTGMHFLPLWDLYKNCDNGEVLLDWDLDEIEYGLVEDYRKSSHIMLIRGRDRIGNYTDGRKDGFDALYK